MAAEESTLDITPTRASTSSGHAFRSPCGKQGQRARQHAMMWGASKAAWLVY
ncbi:hypothetical protein HanPSC8_Chr05g0203141 [Helianthus annuus]|nr:hypothetical protein HanPSC8_Chr05g0203141 [Helianthus annuus]